MAHILNSSAIVAAFTADDQQHKAMNGVGRVERLKVTILLKMCGSSEHQFSIGI